MHLRSERCLAALSIYNLALDFRNMKKFASQNMKYIGILFMSLMLLSFSANVFSQIATTVNLYGNTSTLTITNNVATVVDDALVIEANGTLTDFTVSITGSYVLGDVLSYNGSTPSGISASAFNTTTRSIQFTGTASVLVWQEFLRRVTIRTVSATCYQEQRQVSFVVGKKYYNISNDHFYELSTSYSHFKVSLANANLTSYFGRVGYLATLTSPAENFFVSKILATDSWFGASDNFALINAAIGGTNTFANQGASEGKWYWVTGPEKGTQFVTGNGIGVTPGAAVPGKYSNFGPYEPNNAFSSEHYGEIYVTDGTWNDYPETGWGRTDIRSLIEYGGSATDNGSSNPVSTRNLIISGAPSGTITGGNINVCSGTPFTLTHNGLAAGGSVIRWEYSFDNFLTNPVPINNTTTTLTTTISQTNYYRAVVSNSGCANLVTSSTKITLNETSGGTLFPATLTFCQNSFVDLILNNYTGSIVKWQVSTSSTFANDITDISVTTPTLSYQITGTGNTYYFRAVLSNCGSTYYSIRATATKNTGTPPVGGSVSDLSFCGGSNSGTLQLTSNTGTVSKWQRSVDGGTQWVDISNTTTSISFTGISSTTKYRAVITNGGSCGTAFSSVGTVYVNQAPVGGTISGSGSSACSSVLTLNNYVGAIQWQASTTSTTTGFANIDNATNNTYTTSNQSTTTYYRALVSSGTCSGVYSGVFTLTGFCVPFTLTGDGCVNRTTLSSTNSFTSYAWFLNGTEIPNTNSQTYSPTAAGNYYVRVFDGANYGTSSDITINVCGITQTGKMHATEYLINTLGGAANTTNKGVDERGKIHN